MPLTVDRYTVLLKLPGSDEPTQHEVPACNPDRLRAELECGKRSLDLKTQPMHFTTAFLWAACLREKLIADVGFQTFADTVLLEFEEVEDAPAFPGQETPQDPMGPTPLEAVTGLPSSSSTTSPGPTGEIPTSTPG